jgi:hypothetical protein
VPEHTVADLQEYFCKPDRAFLRIITPAAERDATVDNLQPVFAGLPETSAHLAAERLG